MDLATMRAEVQARGFSHVPPVLIDRWINNTYQDVNDRFPWPFLETTVTGTSPLTIADLSHILYVVDTTNEAALFYDDLRSIIEQDPKLSASGAPYSYYLNSATELRVYPINTTASLSVRYIKVPPDLTGDTGSAATPLSPARFHNIYVEGACAACYRRANEEAADEACLQEVERGVQKMTEALLVPNYDQALTLPDSPEQATSTDW